MVDQEPLRATPEPFVSKPDPLFLSNGKPVTEDALIDIHELNRQDSGLRVLFDESGPWHKMPVGRNLSQC